MEPALPLFSDVLLALAGDRHRMPPPPHEALTDLEAIIRSSPTGLSYPSSPASDRGFLGHLHPRGPPFATSSLESANQVVGPLLDLPPPPPYSRFTCRWIDCLVQYADQEGLVRHIERAHVDQRPGMDFTCLWQGCPRRQRPFNARYKLRIHCRIHTGYKPHKCRFTGCVKAFSRLENLKIHSRSHTGERPYHCQHNGCPKAFSNSSDRAKHQRTHVDTKPYACQVSGCSKRYTDPSSLRKHVKHHREAPFRKKILKDIEVLPSPPDHLDQAVLDSEFERSSEGETEIDQAYTDMEPQTEPNFVATGPCTTFLDHPPDTLFGDIQCQEMMLPDLPFEENVYLKAKEWGKSKPAFDSWPVRTDEDISLDIVHRMCTSHWQGFPSDTSWSPAGLLGPDESHFLRCSLVFADGLGP